MKNKGFTLIELSVVISIISILSIFFIANYQGSEDEFAIKRSAHKLAQDLREAQERTTASQSFKGAYQGGYGISFNENYSYYILFVDCNGDRVFNDSFVCQDCSSGSCVPFVSTELIGILKFEEGIFISNLSSETNGNLSVVFFPPDPNVYFSPNSASEVTIQLQMPSSGKILNESVKINKSGLITIVQ